MPCIADINQIRKLVLHQKEKTNQKMKDLTIELSTYSKYNSLKRSNKRSAEHHMDMVNQEKSLQRDVRKASVIARRIALVIDKVHKDTNKIKDFLGNYNFTNTVGVDSSGTGACSDDLSTGIGTRQAWKDELTGMLTNTYQYVEAQYLGDYTILHDNTSTTDCCSKIYRPVFHYVTPRGDSLTMPSSIGNAHTETSNTSTSNDAKSAPNGYSHMQVSNHDMDFITSYKLFIEADVSTWKTLITAEHAKSFITTLNPTYAQAVVDDEAYKTENLIAEYNVNRVASIKSYLENISCFPVSMVVSVLNLLIDDTTIQPGTESDLDYTGEFVKHVPSFANIEDENDLSFIFKHFTKKMETIRNCQLNNDREQQVLEFVNETSECNQSFHQDAFNDKTQIDISEVKAQSVVGKKICNDLDILYKDICVNKQSFFGKADFSD